MVTFTPRRQAQLAVLVALALSAAIGIGIASDFGGHSKGASATSGYNTKTVTAGPVTVKVRPVRVDRNGAEFDIKLDNHEVDLSMDLAKGARLSVGGTSWAPASWRGDGPSGHHREGRLTFPAAGAPTGPVALDLNGFPSPVHLQWTASKE